MKILFVTTCFPSEELPQYCVFLEQQAISLQKLGHIVEVYHIDDSITETSFEISRNGICIFQRQISHKSSKIEGLFSKRLSDNDEKKFTDVMKRGYDVVSFHFGGLPLFYSVQKICSAYSVPLIHHFHGLNIWKNYFDHHPSLTFYENIWRRKSYAKLSATVNVSNKVQNMFEEVNTSVPSFTVYNGVDIHRFPFVVDRQFFEGNTIRILCVANLIPIKGQKYLIEAAALLLKEGVHVQLSFAGRGQDEEMLRSLAKEKGVCSEFLGYLPYDDVAALMQKNDIFIMPSFYEALGCVYLEAMASGMITVGVRTQGIDEIIVDGENGFLTEPQSVDSLYEVIKNITALSDERLTEISRNGRKTSEQFTWDASAKSLEKVYSEIVKKKE